MRRRALTGLPAILILVLVATASAWAVGDPEEIKSLRGLKALDVEVAVVGATRAAPGVTPGSVAKAIRRLFKHYRLTGSTRAQAMLRVSIQVIDRNVSYISAQLVQSATLIRRPGTRLKVVTWTLNGPVPTAKILEAMGPVIGRLARDRGLAG
ncbi:MAG: hypothetical protein KJ621_08755 [Proteobacteria bacterium]|nr:hypothetical protein [Pseudomonadota bacterium]MBU1742994.1 hypothetical protein [Pseudomonadota bacterium]